MQDLASVKALADAAHLEHFLRLIVRVAEHHIELFLPLGAVGDGHARDALVQRERALVHFFGAPLMHPAGLFLQPFELFELVFVLGEAAGVAQLALLRIVAVRTGVEIRMTFHQLNDAVTALVEEVAVVRNRDDSALIIVQKIAEPLDRVEIQMVGRLVEQ